MRPSKISCYVLRDAISTVIAIAAQKNHLENDSQFGGFIFLIAKTAAAYGRPRARSALPQKYPIAPATSLGFLLNCLIAEAPHMRSTQEIAIPMYTHARMGVCGPDAPGA